MNKHETKFEVLDFYYEDGKYHFKVKQQFKRGFYVVLTSSLVKLASPKDFHKGIRLGFDSDRLFNVLRNRALTFPSKPV